MLINRGLSKEVTESTHVRSARENPFTATHKHEIATAIKAIKVSAQGVGQFNSPLNVDPEIY